MFRNRTTVFLALALLGVATAAAAAALPEDSLSGQGSSACHNPQLNQCLGALCLL
jgi:Spy/CpxP family protein refolding chaperone